MNPEQDVLKALRALSEDDLDKQAPPQVEASLKLAFRRHKSIRRWRQISTWAIAAGILIAVLVTMARSPQPERVTQVPARKSLETATAAVLSAMPAPAETVAVSRSPKARTRHTVEREIVTEFFPLMDVPPPIGRGALVRVYLPAGAMRTVGLPVREDRLAERVQADVLVSEEGLATAIRFVKVSQ